MIISLIARLKMKKQFSIILSIILALFSLSLMVYGQAKVNLDSSKKILPDLVALSMNVQAKDGGALLAAKQTMVGCSLKNNGGAFTGEFRISIRMDGSALGLPMGSTATPDTNGFATPWVATAGTHTATCILDTEHVITESNETNNTISYKFTVPVGPKPDLVPLSMNVAVKDGTKLSAGKETMIGCKLKNNGGPFTEEFRISIRLDGSPLGLPMGSTATPDTTGFATPWTATAGKHTARCILDTESVINESSEANNQIDYDFLVPLGVLHPIDVSGAKMKTDITIEKIEVKAENGDAVSPGKASMVYCHWKRTGTEPSNTFRVLIKMDGTPLTLSQGDTVDQTQTASWLGTPWTATAGEHQIYCEVDAQNAVDESNEKNNKWIQTYILSGLSVHDVGDLTHGPIGRFKTDVSIEKIEVKTEDGSKLTGGKAARIYCYWKRTGAEPAADFRIATYVGPTAIGSALGSTVQHDRTDGWLGTPWTAKTGTHSFKCIADSAFEITEPDETNNTKIQRITIPAPGPIR
jgi:subtilase family serine protease